MIRTILKFTFPALLLALLTLLFFGMGEKIMFAKSGYARILPFVLIFIGIPFCIYKTTLLFLKKKTATNIALLSILILGPGFGLWSDYLSKNDFSIHGKITTGKVIDRWWTTNNNRGRWTIAAEFSYNGKKYITFSKDDNDNKFQINDPISVRFSTRNPENNELLLE